MEIKDKRIFDITVPLDRETPAFPGDPGVGIKKLFGIDQGDPFNLCSLNLTTHSGTHLDPPLHYIPGGRPLDKIPLTSLIARTRVIEIRDRREITRAELEAAELDTSHILFKTANSELWSGPDSSRFKRDYVYLNEEGADYLLENGVRFLGIDYLSIESMESDGRVHRKLLGNDVLILEGIDLSGISPGCYTLVVLPLKITSGDGAPARAVLIEE